MVNFIGDVPWWSFEMRWFFRAGLTCIKGMVPWSVVPYVQKRFRLRNQVHKKENAMSVTDLTAQTLTLTDMIAYQDGSVVSRTLIDKKVGTLTLFAFGVGQGLSEHTAPYDATIQVLDGEAEVIIEGTSYAVKTGQLIIMPANRPHEVRANERFKMLLIMIRA
jgi:quercetin dioxygenase-like cupin family protein